MLSNGGSNYNNKIAEIRQSEFGHASGVTYLDHAGATLYSRSQLEAHFKDLTASLYGNPHSQNQSSTLTSESIDNVRRLVLQHFNTTSSDYDIVFTSGCTGALRLLSESFPFSGSVPSSPGSVPSFPNNECRNVRHFGTTGSHAHEEMEAHKKHVWYQGDAVRGVAAPQELGSKGQSVFCYLEDNHTSVVGMREVAAQRGALLACVTREDLLLPGNTKEAVGGASLKMEEELTENIQFWKEDGSSGNNLVGTPPHLSSDCTGRPALYHLFAYPAQSNFSGCKYPLSWVTDIPLGHVRPRGMEGLGGAWLVLLDAAAYVPTSPLDLASFPAHFVSLSFYKMFGVPTGLGALLVRHDVAHLLHKDYYGGGTVLASISRQNFRIAKPSLHERLEDGTLAFLEITSLVHGFGAVKRLAGSMEEVSIHTWSLARYVHHHLTNMKHANRYPVCVIYCDSDFEDRSIQGATLSLNFLRPTGEFVGYSEVDKLASVQDIHLRTGCFCNTGACMRFLGLSSERVMESIKAGHVCGDNMDLVNGVPTGCVRVSFGYMSTFGDAQKFVEFVQQCFVDQSVNTHPLGGVQSVNTHPLGGVQSMNTHPLGGVQSANTIPLGGVHSVNTHPLGGVQSVNTHPLGGVQSVNTHPLGGVQSVNTHPLGGVQSVNTHPLGGVQSLNTHPLGGVQSMNTHPSDDEWLAPGVLCDAPNVLSLPAAATCGVSLCAGDSVRPVVQQLGDGMPPPPLPLPPPTTLERIFLYPIKSCAAYEVSAWWLGVNGFQYDRLWMVVNERGGCVSQKQEPKLCLVRPVVDLERSRLVLSAEGHSSINVPLEDVGVQSSPGAICQTTVCGDRVMGTDVGDEAASWVSAVIGRQCRLWRQDTQNQRKAKKQPSQYGSVTLSLTNEAQFLLVTRSSVEHLLRVIQESADENSFSYDDVLMRFRPNLVVAGGMPFDEDKWTEVTAGSVVFKVVGPCNRCQMICVNQSTGKRNTDPLQVLLSLRGNKATFGVYLAAES